MMRIKRYKLAILSTTQNSNLKKNEIATQKKAALK